MGRKTEGPKRRTDRARKEADTATYEQAQGAPDPGHPPNRRRAKMPHERDESARATGNRLTQDAPPSVKKISRAGADIERGLVDTERRGIPNDIPGGGRKRKG